MLDPLTTDSFTHARAMTMAHRERLGRYGVTMPALARVECYYGPPGIAKLRTNDDGLWEPDSDGRAMLVQPVTVPTRLRFFDLIDVDSIEFVDTIAFNPAQPARWWWRTGDGWALGLHMLERGAPVPVVATPIEWLAAGGDALVVLDWSAPPIRWLSLLDAPLVVRDDWLRKRLEQTFRRIAPRPQFVGGRHAA